MAKNSSGLRNNILVVAVHYKRVTIYLNSSRIMVFDMLGWAFLSRCDKLLEKP